MTQVNNLPPKHPIPAQSALYRRLRKYNRD